MSRILRVSSAALILGLGLACSAGPTPPSGLPVASPSPGAPAPASPPSLGPVVSTDKFASAGCACEGAAPSEWVFMSNGTDHAMHIDGADRTLAQLKDEWKGKGRFTRYQGGGYDVTMRWKLASEGEGGSNYDVKCKVVRDGGATLETDLDCGCSS
jgi:hypothetical protein